LQRVCWVQALRCDTSLFLHLSKALSLVVDGSQGPLLTLYDVGALLFILALLLVFFYRRIAAAITISASLLCLPVYFYFTAPGPFRRVFRGEYKVPLHANFVWDRWTIIGILTLALVASVGVSSLLISGERKSPDSP
jgi:hypothetical protein